VNYKRGYLGHQGAVRPTFLAHAAQPIGSAAESRHLGWSDSPPFQLQLLLQFSVKHRHTCQQVCIGMEHTSISHETSPNCSSVNLTVNCRAILANHHFISLSIFVIFTLVLILGFPCALIVGNRNVCAFFFRWAQ